MGVLITESRQLLRSASVKFDEQKSDMLNNQKELIRLQNDLIARKDGKLVAVNETVKS